MRKTRSGGLAAEPDLVPQPRTLDEFLRLLPRTTTAAATNARGTRCRDASMRPRRIVNVPSGTPSSCVHRSWFVPEEAALARKDRVALAFSHSSRWPYNEEVTTDLIYLRLHGPGQLYASAHTVWELDRWAARIERWAAGSEPEDVKRLSEDAIPQRRRDVYLYFDNDGHGYAPRQATRLAVLDGGK